MRHITPKNCPLPKDKTAIACICYPLTWVPSGALGAGSPGLLFLWAEQAPVQQITQGMEAGRARHLRSEVASASGVEVPTSCVVSPEWSHSHDWGTVLTILMDIRGLSETDCKTQHSGFWKQTLMFNS